MRRLAAILVLLGPLLLTARATGLPDIAGDPTPPVVTPVIAGTLGDAGWYTSNVTVNWSVVDPESIILSTAGCDARTLTADTAATRLTCTAASDGGETTVSKTFKLDKTAPAPTATPSRSADSNGWYNHGLSVDFAATDTTSGVQSCSATATYSGPDTAGTTVNGSCRDAAGNTAPTSFALKYDASAPQSAASPGRPADANGWYNHALSVSFQGSDPTSGVDTCSQMTYAGPDDASVALDGTCLDKAGNRSSTSTFTFKYDETAPAASATPARPADQNGWYNRPLTVSFAGSDSISGLDSCDAPKTYSAPDNGSAAVTGSCRDLAGNVSPRSFSLRYDATAPQVTAAPGRSANTAGWYSAPVAATFAGSDPVSGVASCDATKTYSGPDSSSAALSGTCVDQAGNVGVASLPLKYDATAPQTSATSGRAADSNGWFNHALTVTFSGGDVTSGIDQCDAAKTYSGPDAAAATVSGACRDKAGNSSPAAYALKYDATAPQASAAAARPADLNGWYRTPVAVDFTGGDALSGLDSCDPAKTYAGPDSGSTSVTGGCRDKAGNLGTASLPLKYDATAPQTSASPSRPANGNGWFNAPVTAGFAGVDVTSGIDSCDPAKSYSGPDIASTTLTGACTDKAGNQSAASLTVRYDATAPHGVATPSRQPNGNGWYNAPLTVSFSATDAMSGVDSCPAARVYSGPDDSSAAVSGTCVDKAGNSGPASLPLKYDASAPLASATASRAANGNGWYNAPLSVSFAATDATSGVDACPAAQTYSGPDDAAASVSGTCVDKAGNGGVASLPVRYDATAPQASATPSRQPNANGWYNAALTVTFAATDATSTVESCPVPRSYSGPDAGSATVSGSCLDKAGNVGNAAFPFKYDATAPQTTAAASRSPDVNGWYNRALTVSFTGTDATSTVASCDPVGSYVGPDNATASVAGTCVDKAGNVGAVSLPFKYDATAPQTTATPSRIADHSGWYNHGLTVDFAGTDATAGLDSCDPAKSYAGPDSASASVTGICRDKAGNAGSGALALAYDATAPQATATPARQPNANGWFNAPLTVSFSGTDATSGIDACDAARTYAGPDASAATLSGACRDRAGNDSASSSFALRYDATAPAVTATPSRAADANGWFNHALTVSFAGTDSTAGVESCDPAIAYAGPDTAAKSIAGACRDKAGNVGSGALAVRFDGTPPVATATPSRQPDRNGWYNAPLSVSFAGSDSTSGLESCDAAKSYSGPDGGAVAVTGACRDKAGNTASPSLLLGYDATAPVATAAPSRPPNANGWFNSPLTVAVNGTDLTAGIGDCTAVQDYAGPDAAAVSLSGSCTDRAGNASAPDAYGFKYDATAPVVTEAVATRPADRNGWYNHAVTFAVQGADATAGLDACPPVTYRGPDDGAASVAGACVDLAGNVGARPFPLRYDGTGPQVAATPTRDPDSGGWYNHPLSVGFSGMDPVSGLASCESPQAYDGPDAELAVVGGICTDSAGNAGVASLEVHYDATAPLVTGAAPERAPDSNGWYNRPLSVGFLGTDETSQIEACTRVAYAGPDAGAASVAGSCRDRAGNLSAASTFALRYDATAPSLTGVAVKAGNRRAELTWVPSPDTTVVEVLRGGKRVYRGTGRSFTDTRLENGVRYRYTLNAYDEAANEASTSVAARPTAPLVAPLAGAKVSRPPRLVWTRVAGATHYNVQLWRSGRILSLWPKGTSVQLERAWTFAGRRYRLTPGLYRWYVWPGYGRPHGKYGPLLGSSSFVVAKS